MHILNSPELVQAIDTYEMFLSEYPDIIPTLCFNILQQETSLKDIGIRTALGLTEMLPPESGQPSGLVTLSKHPAIYPRTDLRLSLLMQSGDIGLPRVSSTKFSRLGGALVAATRCYDNQGRSTEVIRHAGEIQTVHTALAIQTLLSPDVLAKLRMTQAKRDSLQATITTETVTSSRIRLGQALRYTVLK